MINGGPMNRESSPDGFSTLMTSAPMSASSSVQKGPAITWVASSTVTPSSGMGDMRFISPQRRRRG